MEGYKVFTNDLCSPIQGGSPVWDGTLPYQLPAVHVDVDAELDGCGAGWNICREAASALRIAGLWPNGRPSRLYRVEAHDPDVIERKKNCRVATGTLVDEIVDLRPVIEELSAPFGSLAPVMVDEQLAWREALSRPCRDEAAVEAGLRVALEVRRLTWGLRRYDTARAARDVWASIAAWDAWDAWDARAAWDARDVWDAWDTRAAWEARDAWDARAAWDAWDARAARTARDAWAALNVFYVAHKGWIAHPPDLLTRGLRDAYRHGLALALPTGPDTLGWAMED